MATAFEIVKQDREKLVQKVIKNMEKGYIFSTALWNKNMFTPHNPCSNITYKGSNRFRLIFAEDENGYKDSRWLTYKQANELGYKVKKGENGTLLEKWIWSKEEKITNEDGEEETKIIELKKPIVNYFIVYNAEQIDGIPKEETKKMEESDITKTADNFIKSSLCPIEEKYQEKSYYSPQEDKIILPPRDTFKNDKAFLSVVLHEMAHSTGKEGRINRNVRNLFGSEDYAKEELRAELSSYFILSDLGIEDNETINNHTDYLKSWIQVLKNDTNELFRISNESNAISEFLVKNCENILEREEKSDIINNIKVNLKMETDINEAEEEEEER